MCPPAPLRPVTWSRLRLTASCHHPMKTLRSTCPLPSSGHLASWACSVAPDVSQSSKHTTLCASLSSDLSFGDTSPRTSSKAPCPLLLTGGPVSPGLCSPPSRWHGLLHFKPRSPLELGLGTKVAEQQPAGCFLPSASPWCRETAEPQWRGACRTFLYTTADRWPQSGQGRNTAALLSVEAA